jgi:hypothetical protein
VHTTLLPYITIWFKARVWPVGTLQSCENLSIVGIVQLLKNMKNLSKYAYPRPEPNSQNFEVLV